MNDNQQLKNRGEDAIISDLERLSHEDGFIYTLCYMVLCSLFVSPHKLAKGDWHDRLNIQELSLLLGLMVRDPINIVYPQSETTVHHQASTASDLLEELHQAQMYFPFRDGDQNAQDSGARGSRNFDDWMRSGRGMVEPIFYGDDGAYDFQYLEMAEKRYSNDNHWIENRLGTSLESRSSKSPDNSSN